MREHRSADRPLGALPRSTIEQPQYLRRKVGAFATTRLGGPFSRHCEQAAKAGRLNKSTSLFINQRVVRDGAVNPFNEGQFQARREFIRQQRSSTVTSSAALDSFHFGFIAQMRFGKMER
ncbi:hypothetical protein J1605_021066 [Eschrichtius robustus]|uniref:Uncharacterized protein n=1 Tax=Eschrichtius robustus TaxID=9764 RepID=A0AB34HIL5_ESCRO|nr:hypothetical protein J1605_021066 [Eschrichtius robustus]